MRHVAGGNVLRRGLDVRALVVEEDVGAERSQNLALVEAAQEEHLVNSDIPCTQCSDYTFMRGCTARGDERSRNRTGIVGEIVLDPMQTREEFLERPAGERLLRCVGFTARKRREPLFLVDALGLVGEEHRVAVEGDA